MTASKSENERTITDARLKGAARVARKFAMPNYGSFLLEFQEEFYLDEDTHSIIADRLAEKLRDKLKEWGIAR